MVHTVVDAIDYKDLIGKEIYSDKVLKMENGYGSVKVDDILAIVWDN